MVTREDKQVKQKSSVTRHMPSLVTDCNNITLSTSLVACEFQSNQLVPRLHRHSTEVDDLKCSEKLKCGLKSATYDV